MRERARRPFDDVGDLCQRTALDRRQQGLLADAGALRGLSGHRHRARWDISGVENRLPLFDQARATAEARVPLPLPSARQDMQADYRSTGTTLGRHPISFLRAQLRSRGCRMPHSWPGTATAAVCASPDWCACASGHRPPAG